MNSWNIYYTLNTPYKNDSQSIRIITNYLGNLWKNSIYQKIWRSVKKHKARIARQVIVVWSFAALPCFGVFLIKELDVQPGCPVPCLPLAVRAGRHACKVFHPVDLLKAKLEKGLWLPGVVDDAPPHRGCRGPSCGRSWLWFSKKPWRKCVGAWEGFH